MTSRVPSRANAPSRMNPQISSISSAHPSTTNAARRNLFPPRRQNPPTISSSSNTTTTAPTQTSNDSEIIRRETNGTFQIDTPSMPPLPSSHDEDMEEAEVRRRLIEGWRKHGSASLAGMGVDSAEIKAVLMASLDAKVAGLEEDGWMFGDQNNVDEEC